MGACPHCGAERDESGAGPPCCPASLIERKSLSWDDDLRFYVPDGSDPDKVHVWLGGRTSGLIYMDADGEEIILGKPPDCTIDMAGFPRRGAPGSTPDQEGEWICRYDGVAIDHGKVKWRHVERGQDGCEMHYGRPCQ